MTTQRKILHYRDMEARGHGSRWTVKRKVEAGLLPAPIDLGDGRPIWFSDVLQADEDARAKPWVAVGVGPAGGSK